MSDHNKSSSNINPRKPFWSNSVEISKKVTSPSVFNVHQCLHNNPFAAELLETKVSILGQ